MATAGYWDIVSDEYYLWVGALPSRCILLFVELMLVDKGDDITAIMLHSMYLYSVECTSAYTRTHIAYTMMNIEIIWSVIFNILLIVVYLDKLGMVLCLRALYLYLS